ncbi:hypothetical protein ACFQ3P_30075 [Paraburkholderia sabiae]|uniref:Serine/threonine protein kinase n=1 Tax=Paraburkholderia sabiae TaxID=273251 RepID=A0ABU9QHI3_9BURK|nr:hypothetical protein [Paraburkholderia sabiae]WJZ75651.1 hypothetical protein QEN71_07570 [Paraburkholderia sabiae]CAD6557626.1 hypothetical protein LMG24235_06190 [Paraburkholderia sabiae]
MKVNSLLVSSSIAVLLAGCGGGGGDSGGVGTSSNSAAQTSAPSAANGTANGNTTGSLSCASPSTASTSGGGALISADTPSSDGTRMFASGTSFSLEFTTNSSNADTLGWSVTDTTGRVAANGSFPVPRGAAKTKLTCTSTLAGYFAASGSLKAGGGSLPQAGTRPTGIATFGVIPNLSDVVPAVTYAKQEQHRFGMQGANDNAAVLAGLGISQTIDDRQMSVMEPNGANTFSPSADKLDSFYTSGNVMRLIRLDGVPGWASKSGGFEDFTTLPKDTSYLQDYMSRVGTESNAVRLKYFPKQSANFYQVTWEPNQFWTDTDANFVSLYQSVYQGIHSTDQSAVVMGPADAFPSLTNKRLARIASLGYGKYIDGVATHGYYDAGTSPSHPPERLATDPDAATAANALNNSMRTLRTTMLNQYRAGMKLYQTEVGISYDIGSSYGPNYPTGNVLFAQGAVVARTHIILLGEGADVSYVFYGADYPDEVGYGTFFDLSNAQGSYGASNISPKPAAMVVSAMSRILDGTNTLGPVKSTPSGVYAYSFQQLNNGSVITALWTHSNNAWSANSGFSSTYSVAYNLTVDSPGTSGTVKVLDMMGNPMTLHYTDGTLKLNLTEAPIYVVSKNADVAKSNVNPPPGYVGS